MKGDIMDLKELAAGTGWDYHDPYAYYRELGEEWPSEYDIVSLQSEVLGKVIDVRGNPEGVWYATLYRWDGGKGKWIEEASASHEDGALSNYLMVWMGGEDR